MTSIDPLALLVELRKDVAEMKSHPTGMHHFSVSQVVVLDYIDDTIAVLRAALSTPPPSLPTPPPSLDADERLREAAATANVVELREMFPDAGWDVVIRNLIDRVAILGEYEPPSAALSTPPSLDRDFGIEIELGEALNSLLSEAAASGIGLDARNRRDLERILAANTPPALSTPPEPSLDGLREALDLLNSLGIAGPNTIHAEQGMYPDGKPSEDNTWDGPGWCVCRREWPCEALRLDHLIRAALEGAPDDPE